MCECVCLYVCVLASVSGLILIGWPNQLGRPEFVNLHRHGYLYELAVKLQPPDYTGGLTADTGLQYEIHLADAGNYDKEYFITSIDPSNITEFLIVPLLKDFIIGKHHLHNVYYLLTRMMFRSRNSGLAQIIALPGDSPFLIIDTLCTFFGETNC